MKKNTPKPLSKGLGGAIKDCHPTACFIAAKVSLRYDSSGTAACGQI